MSIETWLSASRARLESPPLVRERLFYCTCQRLQARITPARAGKTSIYLAYTAAGRDHPRSCGKDVYKSDEINKAVGSPPLVWERLPLGPCRDTGRRDHPRSCGKDSLTRRTKDFILGSPPLVRERPSTDSGKVTVFGITPARAGKTFPHIRNFKQIRDHPRSCGKDHLCHEVVNQLAGSPLLVRERHECLLANKGQSGIAPARAGKTRLS